MLMETIFDCRHRPVDAVWTVNTQLSENVAALLAVSRHFDESIGTAEFRTTVISEQQLMLQAEALCHDILNMVTFAVILV